MICPTFNRSGLGKSLAFKSEATDTPYFWAMRVRVSPATTRCVRTRSSAGSGLLCTNCALAACSPSMAAAASVGSAVMDVVAALAASVSSPAPTLESPMDCSRLVCCETLACASAPLSGSSGSLMLQPDMTVATMRIIMKAKIGGRLSLSAGIRKQSSLGAGNEHLYTKPR